MPKALHARPCKIALTPGMLGCIVVAMKLGTLRFKAWLKATATSQADAAAKLGCNQSTVSRICAGAQPDLTTAVAIREVTADFVDGPIDSADWLADAPEGQAAANDGEAA